MRLQKFLASAGIASRRACENLILEGRVCVNGEIAALGSVIDPERDSVTFDGKSIYVEKTRVILLFHKPRGVVCTNSDPEGRRTVTSYFTGIPERLFNVGRLDIDSEGLLIMTNDGDLMQALTHPSREVEKTYYVECTGELTPSERSALENGVQLDDGMTAPARVGGVKANGSKTSFTITIHEGRNRQVRRMVEAVGHRTLRLRRQSIGELSLQGLAPGTWRQATVSEIEYLDGCIGRDKQKL